MKSNQDFFLKITIFIAVTNLCLYVGLLQFCGVLLFFSSSFFSPSLYLILIFKKTHYFFSTFIPLFAFPALFPFQLIFSVYKSSLSTYM